MPIRSGSRPSLFLANRSMLKASTNDIGHAYLGPNPRAVLGSI